MKSGYSALKLMDLRLSAIFGIDGPMCENGILKKCNVDLLMEELETNAWNVFNYLINIIRLVSFHAFHYVLQSNMTSRCVKLNDSFT